jgi:hypothetical protein
MRYLLIILFIIGPALFGREIRVTSEGAGQATIARLQAQAEPAFEHIYNKIGVADEDPLFLQVVGTAAAFEQIARTDGVGMDAESVLGYAIPSRRRVVLNLSAITERGLDAIGVLRHELAHLVLGSQLRIERPLWFEEGVAQYVESVALNELREAAGTPSLASFDSLADLSAGLRQEGRAGAAYSESREVIRLIVARHGDEAFKRLMKALERGEGPFETAFAAHCETLAGFEAAWLEDQSSRNQSKVARFFGGIFWWVLLGLTGAMLPLIWLLRRRRGKSQVELWEDQEKHYPSDPSWSYTDE